MSGRGFGKTRTGAEWVRKRARQGNRNRWIAIVAETPAEARDKMIEGPAGILHCSPPWERPHYEPSKRRLTWPTGSWATVFSAQEPDQLRGFSGDTAWLDEPAIFKHLQKVFDNLLLGMREAKVSAPRLVLTTTPKPLALLKDLLKDPDCVKTMGSSYENRANLDPKWFRRILRRYVGTPLEAQEIMGSLLDQMPGALWQRLWIQQGRYAGPPPELDRIVVAVDPPGGHKAENAEAGIVVAGKRREPGPFGAWDHLYPLADRSLRGTPDQWGKAAVDAYREFGADAIVGEVNYGGEMVGHTIRTVEGGKDANFKAVSASRGKVLRAEPVSSLYAQGRGHHCANLTVLEDELCTWEPDSGLPSPNRLDALVWAATELILGAETVTDAIAPSLRR